MNCVKRVDQKAIILSIILVTILIINFSSIKENLFFQPSAGTVGACLLDIKNNPNNYLVITPENIDSMQNSLVQEFIQNFSLSSNLNINEVNSFENKIFIGLSDSFSNLPYNEFLLDKQAIVVFNSTQNSLYVYAYDIESLSYIIHILSDLNSNEEILNYPQIELVEGYIEELFLEPVAVSSRVVSPLFLNEEAFVELNVKIFRPIDSLLLAELTSPGFNIKDKSSGFIINSTNLIVWYLANLAPGDYYFNYSFIPSVSNGNLLGKVGVKAGNSEEDYSVLGQSAFSVSSRDNPNNPGDNPGSGGGNTPNSQPINTNFISYNEIVNGKLIYLNLLESLNFELNPGEIHNISLKEIQKNYASFLIQSNPIVVNAVLNQVNKISLISSKKYDLLIRLESIESNRVSVFLKKIDEIVSSDNFDTESPASINSGIFDLGKDLLERILIFSALVLFILIVTLLIFSKKKKVTNNQQDKSDLFEKAKAIVSQYKLRGYTYNQIKQSFRDKGWKEADINRIV